jgi:hypothetical protein
MTSRDEGNAGGTARALDRDEDEVLSGSFYAPKSEVKPMNVQSQNTAEKPTHYKVICISLYNKDLQRLDDMVETLKAKGLTKANRSALIRAALEQVDLEKVPKGI